MQLLNFKICSSEAEIEIAMTQRQCVACMWAGNPDEEAMHDKHGKWRSENARGSSYARVHFVLRIGSKASNEKVKSKVWSKN